MYFFTGLEKTGMFRLLPARRFYNRKVVGDHQLEYITPDETL
jgi:hypothetical protein